MASKTFFTTSLLATLVAAQQAGTNTPETHPSLPISSCSASGGCTTLNTSITLDANWRWTHQTSSSTNCYTGNEWDTSICTSPSVCASSCALDGADYEGTYGITTSEDALSLTFVTGENVGSRNYLLNEEGTEYRMFNLLNQEFSFTVDVSDLPCGLNGALYFVEMPSDGGMSTAENNKAGAKYGTGYCDSQCPQDVKFINGEANIIDWTPSTGDPNTGTGSKGACCAEMDIWEANSISAAYTPHPCNETGLSVCDANSTCGAQDRYSGTCDRDGCDFNSFRLGNESFYGPSKIIDTTKPFTVTTQFVTDDETANGTLTEIRRIYSQDGKKIQNSVSDIEGIDAVNSITSDFCTQQKTAFGDTNSFATAGGLASMGAAMGRGMVLVMSIWDDYAAEMQWLDATYPVDGTGAGVKRGTCGAEEGAPETVEAEHGDAKVVFSAVKVGEIGSTTA